MKNTRLELQQKCPGCQSEMQIHSVRCEPCGIAISGTFATNEFALLEADDLHFLRIFIQAEGRIREMEAPLGWTYPTIRNRLTKLKQRLGLDLQVRASDPDNEDQALDSPSHPDKKPAEVAARKIPKSVKEVLDLLESGDINPQVAGRYLKKFKAQN